jgi:hypothetical protein
MNDKISEEEVFANAYHYFVEALKVLAADADTQCEYMSNYNVAWQLKDDVSRSAGILKLPGAQVLTQEEREGIVAMVEVLNELPSLVLDVATTEEANRKAMTDPCWTPLRARAADLLSLLAATTRRNEDFLAGRKGHES